MEEDLIRGAQTGDSAAFRALVERYTPVAWRVALALAPERSQAEDIMQDAWIDVWRGLPLFDIARPFRPWLLTIVANRCRMLARKRTVSQLALTDVIADELLDTDDGFEPGRFRSRQRTAIRARQAPAGAAAFAGATLFRRA